MNLRERCEKLSLEFLRAKPIGRAIMTNAIEAFAREIRNEALEEAASIADDVDDTYYIGSNIAKDIRAFKTTALAAKED